MLLQKLWKTPYHVTTILSFSILSNRLIYRPYKIQPIGMGSQKVKARVRRVAARATDLSKPKVMRMSIIAPSKTPGAPGTTETMERNFENVNATKHATNGIGCPSERAMI